MNKKSFTTLLWVSVLVGLFTFIFFNGKEYQTLPNLVISFIFAGLYSFVIGYGNFGLNYFLSKKFSWIDDTRERTSYGIIGAVLVNIMLVLFCDYINLILVNKNNPEDFFKGSMMAIHIITVNISLLISAILHAKDFMEEWKKSAKSQVTEQKIIAKSANAQFESLKNQLDPHFLFNSLNVLSALIDENPEQAQRFTSSMSKIYRYVLDEKDKELVTVGEELDFAKTYCELLKTRFEDSVIFEVEVEEKVRKMFVVPLSLQLLLENAIKHNFATDSKPLVIKIYSENQQLIVENNLQQREVISEREGIGLSNIVQRYSLLTKDHLTIDKSEDYFRIKLPILKEKITAMTNYEKTQEILAYEKAAKRVSELRNFYGNLISYCIAIPILIIVNLVTNRSYLWFFWPMFGWGASILIHAIAVFGIGKNWEERQIQKYMKITK